MQPEAIRPRAAARRQRETQSLARQLSLTVVLLIVALLVAAYKYSASPQFYWKLGVLTALFLLFLRYLLRRVNGKRKQAAEPDPLSRLNLQ